MSTDASALFQAFVEGVSPDQEPDIDALCREHPEHQEELRERFAEWQAILKDIRLGRVSLDSPVSGDSSASIGDVVHRLRERLGEESRYEILGEFARGGMGAILRVWDRSLRRMLAMKIVLGDQSVERGGSAVDDRTLGRFVEEAQVTGQLDHPGIVPVHEIGLDDEGKIFFTMRLVKGDDLRAVFEMLRGGEGGWTQTRVLGVILKVCEALAYAHSKGVIHRDLKPANIMVGRFGEAYVMDWGLAHVVGRQDSKDIRPAPLDALSMSRVRTDRREDSDADSPLLTMDGDVVGTPAFMSPEQARGEIAAMSPASDVYALGAILYQLLAGHMPYVPLDARLNAHAVWALAQQGPPTPVAQLAPEAPVELIAICEKAMARDPQDRYADMTEMAADMRAFVEGRVVQAHRTGALIELKKWVYRNRLVATTAAAALLIITLLTAWFLVSLRASRDRADENATLARRRADEAEAEKLRVLRLSDIKTLSDLKAQIDDLWPAHPENLPAMDQWLEAARAVLQNLGDHERTLADLRLRGTPGVHPREAELAELKDQAAPEDRIESLSVAIERERPHAFSKAQDDWWHDTLVSLVTGLVALADDDPYGDTIANISERRKFAGTIEKYSTTYYPAEWDEAIASITNREECPLYNGLRITKQLGLVPIGQDPQSGLWEFWHVQTGARPQRDEDGQLGPTEEMGVVLVLIPGGTFWMGCQGTDPEGRNYDPGAFPNSQSNEGRPVEVTLDPYFLSKYELTQGQWKRLTGHNPSGFGPDGEWKPHWLSSGAEASLLHPVEQVSWLELIKWLPRADLTLPSEAQWEYGARAGTDSVFWSGSTPESLEGVANISDAHASSEGPAHSNGQGFADFDDGATHHGPVGSYRGNAFGLHDVHGNVREWCLDEYDSNFYGMSADRNPLARSPDPIGGTRTYRGGNFRGSPWSSRVASRHHDPPDFRGHGLGARPARAISE